LPFVKVNTDGSVVDGLAACGGIFRDYRGSFLGCFASNLGQKSVFEAELFGFVLALEFAIQHGWQHLWVEGDSQCALQAFGKPKLVLFALRNRWYNCNHGGISILSSHFFWEGNCCADKLANHGHTA